MKQEIHLENATKDLQAILRSVGAPLDLCRKELDRCRTLLQEESRIRNITKYRSPEEIILYHFVDSLQVLRQPGLGDRLNVIDVGTGPGLPGLPCAIVRTRWRITLLDSNQKQIRFLEKVVVDLLPGRAKVALGRAEDLAHQCTERGAYDLVLARALAPLPNLLELTLPFLKPGGLLIAHRGARWREEVGKATTALETLAGEWEEPLPYRLRGREREHALVVVRLLSPPDRKYPRSPAHVRHQPL